MEPANDDIIPRQGQQHVEVDENEDEEARRRRAAAIADELGGDVWEHNYLEAEEEQQPEEMWLSPLETFWARQLKDHVERQQQQQQQEQQEQEQEQEQEGASETTDSIMIRPMSDMEYAEMALITHGNLDDAMRRIRGMQRFQDLYQIEETVEECIHYIRELVFRVQPGVMIHLDVSKDTGTAIVAWDWGAVNPKRALASEHDWKCQIVADYYFYKSQQPTFRSIRQGVYYLIEAQQMSWDNFDMTMESRYYDELLHYIPIKIKHIMVYNTNMVVNLAFGLLKKLMPKEHQDVIRFGCKYDWENETATLGDMFLQPSREVAMERLIQKAKHLITIRYQNNNNFKL